MKKITIGARGSKLSLAYVSKVKNLILESAKNIEINVVQIKTSGDIHKDIKLSKIGGKNLFCKEIEENLIKNEIDIAVHSLKDMESKEHADLMIGAFIKRNDPRDTFVSEKIKHLSEINNEIVVGSSSRRRELQLKKINKNIKVVNIRGNIDTRISKIKEKKLDGIILAAAGLKSLNLENKISFTFEPNEMLPAIGQGIIAVQCRKNDNFIIEILKKISHVETSLCAIAERKVLQTIEGDCETAIGGLAEINRNNLRLRVQLFSDLGDEIFVYEMSGKDTEAFNIGDAVGKKLLDLAGEKYKKK